MTVPFEFTDLPLPTTLRDGGAFTVGAPARTRELLLFEQRASIPLREQAVTAE